MLSCGTDPQQTRLCGVPRAIQPHSTRQQTHGIDKFSRRTNKFKNAALHELLKMNRMLLPVLFCKNGNHRPSDDYSTDDCTCIGAFNRGAGMKQTIIKQLKILYSDRQYIERWNNSYITQTRYPLVH